MRAVMERDCVLSATNIVLVSTTSTISCYGVMKKMYVTAWKCRECGEIEITMIWGYWNSATGAERIQGGSNSRCTNEEGY